MVFLMNTSFMVVTYMLVFLTFIHNKLVLSLEALFALWLLLLFDQFFGHCRQIRVIFHVIIILKVDGFLLGDFVGALTLYFGFFRVISFFARVLGDLVG